VGSSRHGAFDVAQSGVITWHWTATSQPIWRIRWFDMKGVVTGAVGDLGMYVSLALSPDESKLAVLQGSPIEHIWLYNLQNGTSARVSSLPGNQGNPVWSPDSRTLYYTVGTEAHQQLVRQDIASGSQPEVLYESRGPRPVILQDITPDGRHLMLIRRGQGPETGIFRLDVSDSAAPRELQALLPNGNATLVRISPEGRSLVFITGAAVFASRYPPSGQQPRQIGSFRGGSYPFFSRDGRTLYFFAERSVISQPVLQNPAGEVSLGERSVLFPIFSGARVAANLGAASRDGKRLLVISTDDDDELRTHVLTDWTALLKD
jgi:Tol biopolymer transport system component